ncbi:MAG: hypothetical protein AAGD07_12240 [Planctomycetota bacterium]
MQTRRQLLRSGAAALATPSVISSACLGQGRPAPSERLSIGVIGLGSRGFNLIDELLGLPAAQITMICDVDSFHYRDRPWGQGKQYGINPAKDHIEKKDPSTKGLRCTGDERPYFRPEASSEATGNFAGPLN